MPPQETVDEHASAATSGTVAPAGEEGAAMEVTPALSDHAPSADTLGNRIRGLAQPIEQRRRRHDVLAGRWSAMAGWARLTVALAASLSTVSVLASNDAAAVVFSVTTAVISALNAAYNPEQAGKAHRAAAIRYARLFRRLDDLLYVLDDNYEGVVYLSGEGEPGDQGRYVAAIRLTSSELLALARRLAEIENQIDAADEASPPLNRLRTPRSASLAPDEWPTTFWSLRRYRRALRYAGQAHRLYEQATRDGPSPARH